jgi:soluble lytic murein transglycosylase-like protein
MLSLFRHLAAPALVHVGVALALALALGTATAGRQQYEPLSDAVRTALASAVRDEAPGRAPFDGGLERTDWLAAMSAHLPRRWKPEHRERVEFLDTVRYEAGRAGLDPHLVLGLIEVESGFRRYAISHAGARGYMQVMPFWTGVIGDQDPAKLFDMRANLRYGCTILRHYLDIERGNLFRALGRYNGSLGREQYPNAVLHAWKRWEARVPAARGGPDAAMLARQGEAAQPARAANAAARSRPGIAALDRSAGSRAGRPQPPADAGLSPLAAGPAVPADR